MNHIISLPSSVQIPETWLNTPLKPFRVLLVAQSRLQSLTEQQLTKTSRILNVTMVGSIIGTVVSLYLRNKLAVIVMSLASLISLIGRTIIHCENKARSKNLDRQACVDACFELEDWLIQLRIACEMLRKRIEPFKALLSSNPRISAKKFVNLQNALNDFPKEKCHDLVDKFAKQKLFEKTRRFARGNRSNDLHYHLKYFGEKLRYFYTNMNILKYELKDLEKKETYDPKKMNIAVSPILKDLKNPCMPEASRSDPSSGGRFIQGNLIEVTEQWRQNIAVFRSSLS